MAVSSSGSASTAPSPRPHRGHPGTCQQGGPSSPAQTSGVRRLGREARVRSHVSTVLPASGVCTTSESHCPGTARVLGYAPKSLLTFILFQVLFGLIYLDKVVLRRFKSLLFIREKHEEYEDISLFRFWNSFLSFL